VCALGLAGVLDEHGGAKVADESLVDVEQEEEQGLLAGVDSTPGTTEGFVRWCE
jgi:hypothetical protein